MEEKQDKKNINLEKLKKELEEAKAKCEEYLNGWKRERADFLNYKKEEMERMGQFVKYANEEIILKILPILDNIYLAESHVPAELKEESTSSSADSSAQTSAKVWIDGFLQIKKQLSDFLSKEGIEPIKTIGEKFNPNFMEAIEEVVSPTSDVGETKGVVTEEVQRGYTMHGKIIRPAKVKVAK